MSLGMRPSRALAMPWTCRSRWEKALPILRILRRAPSIYAAHGFLGYVAGQPEEKTIIPKRPPREEILHMPTLADLVSGKIKGRTNDQQTSWFLNLGVMGVQFAAVCATVYNEAKKNGIGKEIPTEWFTQSIRD